MRRRHREKTEEEEETLPLEKASPIILSHKELDFIDIDFYQTLVRFHDKCGIEMKIRSPDYIIMRDGEVKIQLFGHVINAVNMFTYVKEKEMKMEITIFFNTDIVIKFNRVIIHKIGIKNHDFVIYIKILEESEGDREEGCEGKSQRLGEDDRGLSGREDAA